MSRNLLIDFNNIWVWLRSVMLFSWIAILSLLLSFCCHVIGNIDHILRYPIFYFCPQPSAATLLVRQPYIFRMLSLRFVIFRQYCRIYIICIMSHIDISTSYLLLWFIDLYLPKPISIAFWSRGPVDSNFRLIKRASRLLYIRQSNPISIVLVTLPMSARASPLSARS